VGMAVNGLDFQEEKERVKTSYMVKECFENAIQLFYD
jgi:hypothetical protein